MRPAEVRSYFKVIKTFKACKPISEYKQRRHIYKPTYTIYKIFCLKLKMKDSDFTYPLQSSDHRFEEEYTSRNPYSLGMHEERCDRPF